MQLVYRTYTALYSRWIIELSYSRFQHTYSSYKHIQTLTHILKCIQTHIQHIHTCTNIYTHIQIQCTMLHTYTTLLYNKTCTMSHNKYTTIYIYIYIYICVCVWTYTNIHRHCNTIQMYTHIYNNINTHHHIQIHTTSI